MLRMSHERSIGTVAETAIYPFKGMQGVQMDEIALRSVSVVGDRRRAYSILDSKSTPTLLDTIKYHGLLGYCPELVIPDDPNSAVMVHTPYGDIFSAESRDLKNEISAASKQRLELIRLGRGLYHSMPVSLVSYGSIKAIEEVTGGKVDPRRFRENILVQTEDGEPFVEDQWIGHVITFGDRPNSARIAVVKVDERCATVNLDPETGEYTGGIFEAIRDHHQKNLGVYCSIVSEGTICEGDTLYITPLG